VREREGERGREGGGSKRETFNTNFCDEGVVSARGGWK